MLQAWNAATLAEREACAEIADAVQAEADALFREKSRGLVSDSVLTEQSVTAERIANAIRARGDK